MTMRRLNARWIAAGRRRIVARGLAWVTVGRKWPGDIRIPQWALVLWWRDRDGNIRGYQLWP